MDVSLIAYKHPGALSLASLAFEAGVLTAYDATDITNASPAAIKKWYKRLPRPLVKPTKIACFLSPAYYQFMAMAKPVMPADEICQSLPFLLKDLLPNASDMAFDYVDLIAGGGKKMMTVATRMGEMVDFYHLMEKAQLKPAVISIAEYAYVALAQKNRQKAARPFSGVLYQSAESTRVIITQGMQWVCANILSRQSVQPDAAADHFAQMVAHLEKMMLDVSIKPDAIDWFYCGDDDYFAGLSATMTDAFAQTPVSLSVNDVGLNPLLLGAAYCCVEGGVYAAT